jgi:hypothetical protein
MKIKSLFAVIAFLFIGVIIGYYIGTSRQTPLPQQPDAKPNTNLTCTYKGKVYNDGEGFKDECNSCGCKNGEVFCTMMACIE